MKSESAIMVFAGQVCLLEEALMVLEEIEKQTEAIRSSAHREFIGYVRQRSIESAILRACNIYEREKGYPIGSIQKIKMAISQGILLPQTEPANEFIRIYASPETAHTESLVETIEGFGRNQTDALNRLKKIRDKKIGHAQLTDTEFRFSINEIKTLYKFAYDLLKLIAPNIGLDGRIGMKTRFALNKLLLFGNDHLDPEDTESNQHIN